MYKNGDWVNLVGLSTEDKVKVALHIHEGDNTESMVESEVEYFKPKYFVRHNSYWFFTEDTQPRVTDITERVLKECGLMQKPTDDNDGWSDVPITGKKYDQGKPLYNLIPVNAESEMVDVLTFGAEKYGPNNWRNIDNLTERYTAAAMRHLASYRKGEKLDPESGKHHLAHAMCCLAFILENDLTSEDV